MNRRLARLQPAHRGDELLLEALDEVEQELLHARSENRVAKRRVRAALGSSKAEAQYFMFCSWTR